MPSDRGATDDERNAMTIHSKDDFSWSAGRDAHGEDAVTLRDALHDLLRTEPEDGPLHITMSAAEPTLSIGIEGSFLRQVLQRFGTLELHIFVAAPAGPDAATLVTVESTPTPWRMRSESDDRGALAMAIASHLEAFRVAGSQAREIAIRVDSPCGQCGLSFDSAVLRALSQFRRIAVLANGSARP